MKMLRFTLAVVIGGSLLQGGSVYAQRTVATYSKEAMGNLAPLLEKAARDGFKLEANTTTVFGGWLPQGRGQGNERWVPILIMHDVDPNAQYRVIAAGDNDTKDLDLRIVDPAGKVVVQDVAVAREAEVTFQPQRRQDYVIQLRLFDSTDNCVCIGSILKK
jgi:hypothetical protein